MQKKNCNCYEISIAENTSYVFSSTETWFLQKQQKMIIRMKLLSYHTKVDFRAGKDHG